MFAPLSGLVIDATSVFIWGHPWVNLCAVKLISWNVNGLRAVLKKNFLEFLDAEKPDVLCLQETKCTPDQVEQLWPAHYTTFWNSARRRKVIPARRFSRRNVRSKSRRISALTEHDKEGRVLTAEYKDFFLVNVYVPNSKRELERLPYRQVWDKDFLALPEETGKEKARDLLRRPERGAHGD